MNSSTNNHQIIRREVPATPALTDGLHPLLQRIYAARGISEAGELSYDLPNILPPDLMGGASEASVLLADAISERRRILVVGDFDTDGATSCALSVLALRAMGCRQVDYLLPNRFEYGYGLTPQIVDLAAQQSPDLIVTVDNGISSVNGVRRAAELGMPVIVTDHHLPGDVLPDAAAIVNPNVPGNGFPSRAAAGVGVIFYVLMDLRAELRRRGWFEEQGLKEPNLANWLDLVALGTVADLVPLDRNNRILVHQGLQRMRAGRCRPGILALMQVAGRNPLRMNTADLGYSVAPRLNAAGRLVDMTIGVECLLTDDFDRALQLAGELDSLNHERRDIEREMKAQASELLAQWQSDTPESLPWGLCLYDENWHHGVVGILASRIKERHHRPVVAFAPGEQGELKGSARSIPGFHIRDALEEIATAHPGLLTRFGGHAMAAGLTIEPDNLPEFRAAFDDCARRHLNESDLQAVLLSDGEVPGDDLSLEFAQQIAQAGPWGQGFPEPLFDGYFEVIQQRVVGEKHWKLRLRHESGRNVDAIAFHFVDNFPDKVPERVRIAYRLAINEYRDIINLQLMIDHMESA